MKRLAILASHNGSGFDALYKAAQNGELDIEIVLLISNNTSSPALVKAAERSIDNFIVNTKTNTDPNKKIEELLEEYACEYVFLSGYMKKLPPRLTQRFRIINSHPALLPKYGGEGMYGRFVHEAVIQNGEKMSGVSIHLIDENYDEGKMILQKELLLSEDESAESLENKIKELEALAIVEAFKTL